MPDMMNTLKQKEARKEKEPKPFECIAFQEKKIIIQKIPNLTATLYLSDLCDFLLGRRLTGVQKILLLGICKGDFLC
jgi:hypothetical protein